MFFSIKPSDLNRAVHSACFLFDSFTKMPHLEMNNICEKLEQNAKLIRLLIVFDCHCSVGFLHCLLKRCLARFPAAQNLEKSTIVEVDESLDDCCSIIKYSTKSALKL